MFPNTSINIFFQFLAATHELEVILNISNKLAIATTLIAKIDSEYRGKNQLIKGSTKKHTQTTNGDNKKKVKKLIFNAFLEISMSPLAYCFVKSGYR